MACSTPSMIVVWIPFHALLRRLELHVCNFTIIGNEFQHVVGVDDKI